MNSFDALPEQKYKCHAQKYGPIWARSHCPLLPQKKLKEFKPVFRLHFFRGQQKTLPRKNAKKCDSNILNFSGGRSTLVHFFRGTKKPCPSLALEKLFV
jgi:hypothetical protein